MFFGLTITASAQTWVNGNNALTSDVVESDQYFTGSNAWAIYATSGYYPGGSTYEKTITLHFLGTYHVFISVNGGLVLRPGDWSGGIPIRETTITFSDSAPLHFTGGWGNGGQIDCWLYPTVPATNISFSTTGGWHPGPFTVTPVVHAAPGLSIVGGNYAPVPVSADGETDLTFTASDNFGYTATATFAAKIDSTSIPIQISGQPPNVWYNSAKNVWLPVFTATKSGLASASYQIGYSQTPINSPSASNMGTVGQSVSCTSGVSISLPGASPANGYYYLLVSAVNGAGTGSQQLSGPYQYNATAPILQPPTARISSDGTNVQVNWQVPVGDVSGIASYNLSYTSGINQNAVSVPVSANATQGVLNLSGAGLYGQSLKFSLVATDGAGNSSSPVSVSVTIPPQLSLHASNDSASNDQTMAVDLNLGVSVADFQEYTSLSITRQIGFPSGNQVSTLSLPSIPSGLSSSTLPWRVDSSGNLVFVDTIATSTGAGGKVCSYSVTSVPAIAQINGGSVSLALPSHPGNLTLLQIVDMAGKPYGSSSFQIDGSGRVQVDLQGSGIDQDTWTIEIDRVTAVTNGGSTLTSYTKLGGSSSINYAYNSSTASYPETKVPITMALGTNNIQVLWTQAGDSSSPKKINYSQFLSADYEKSASGYTLNIQVGNSPTVQTTASGSLLVSPGEPVNLSLAGVDPSAVSWDFGDGTAGNPDTVSGTLSVSHKYPQAAGQTSDSTTYYLALSISGVGTTIPITVQDTQDGSIYISEVWNGPHTVTGNVTVPVGLKLSIGSDSTVNTTVTFQGGLASGTNQGLTVQGNLKVGPNPVTFSAAGSSWGTILVAGPSGISAVASFADAIIEGADRGVTVGPSSVVALNLTSFAGNNIGLQTYGPSTARASGCSFTGNTAYGVKEDAGGRPAMTGNTFSGNAIDYYAFGMTSDIQARNLVGVLSMSELNQLPNGTATSNSGNTSVSGN